MLDPPYENHLAPGKPGPASSAGQQTLVFTAQNDAPAHLRPRITLAYAQGMDTFRAAASAGCAAANSLAKKANEHAADQDQSKRAAITRAGA